MSAAITVRVERDGGKSRALLEAMTRLLPEWFGQADSNRHYAEQAETLDAWVASTAGRDVGLLLVKNHGPINAEIYWMGIDPVFHRQGIGQALVEAVRQDLARKDMRFLFVMTLHPDAPYEPYQHTRRFYEALGFVQVLTPQGFGDKRNPCTYYLACLA